MRNGTAGDSISVGEQLQKLKENWLLILLVLLVLLFLSSGNLFGALSSFSASQGFTSADYGSYKSSAVSRYYEAGGANYRDSGSPYGYSGDFAPEVKDRKITKQSDVSTEVERGRFKEAESKVTNIVSSSGSFLLSQNVNRYGEEKKSYYAGTYTIKVEAGKYDAVVAQLKEIGKVTSFRESQLDITATYENLNIEIQAEKARLERYRQLFNETAQVEQKIQLTDKIFEQERKISYLEESLANTGQRVDYSTIILSVNEKRSEYAYVVLVKLSELVKSFVDSVNTLVRFAVIVLPWAAAFLLLRFLYRLFKDRRGGP
ncbi:MAG: DUF4349 domain-containing protein [Candidatus Aenigmarchaeota archaeon]|nr:DUF4349 domain-containing protein [Candidatus Aenigmarchaeota archaeon]